MGRILANSGPRYRKELPSTPPKAMAPTLLAFLTESVELWSYLEDCLHPDHKISAKHAIRISNSVKIIAENLFAYCTAEEAPHYLQPILTGCGMPRATTVYPYGYPVPYPAPADGRTGLRSRRVGP